ncbi:stage VI sporulation protein F [Aureibacillus halotolerans]|uniref:Stage VI sporulation protein F n=1 Tax=Aureibacillus halotolerans TaxID=1508390 RepID=A0A4R6U2V9_9BACI|nr:stage VI sporulation protein F [Aureibacillus halotolerans]TDQ40331.1 stage VI sporulation protein F [Aureibacillus halotolerans]
MAQNPFFDSVEKKTGVKMNDLLKLADSLQHANLRDEKTVRQVIQQVSLIANKPVSKQKEDKLVQAILKDNVPLDFSSLSKMMDKK